MVFAGWGGAVDTACANFEEVEWLQGRSFPVNLEGWIVSDKFRRIAYVWFCKASRGGVQEWTELLMTGCQLCDSRA